MTNETLYWLLTGSISVIAFFLIRFFFLVDEIRKDVKELLIRGAAQDEIIIRLEEDIKEMKRDIRNLESLK